MKVAIDAVGIRGDGGAAVLCELLYWLPKARPEWKWHVFIFDRSLRQFDVPSVDKSIYIEYTKEGNKAIERMRWIKDKLPKKLEKIQPDILFCFANIGLLNSPVPQVIFVQQPNAFFSNGIPWSNFYLRFKMWYMRNLILKSAEKSRAIIVQTNSMKEKIISYAPKLQEKTYVVPSGFHTPSSTELIRNEIKIKLGSLGRPLLVYISLPRIHKNHITLIRAFAKIKNNFPDASLILTAGKDNPFDKNIQKTKNLLNNEIRTLGLSDSIIWFEWLNPDEVNYVHSECDLMVFPSLAESFGLPLVEAMTMGCPILASDLPYAHDVAGDAAIYFNPHNSDALAECIRSVLSSPQILKGLSNTCKERSKLYSYKNIAEQIADIIEKEANQ